MVEEPVDAAEESESEEEAPPPKRRCQQARIEEDPLIDYVELRGMIYKILEEREAQQPKAPAAGGMAGYAVAAVGVLSLINTMCPLGLKADIADKFASLSQPFLDQSRIKSVVRLKTGPTEECDETSTAQNEPATEPSADCLRLVPSTSVES